MKTKTKLTPIEWHRTPGLLGAPEWTAFNAVEGWTARIAGPSSGSTTYHWEFIGNTRVYSQRVLPHEPFPTTLVRAYAAVKAARERWVRQRRAEVGAHFGQSVAEKKENKP